MERRDKDMLGFVGLKNRVTLGENRKKGALGKEQCVKRLKRGTEKC